MISSILARRGNYCATSSGIANIRRGKSLPCPCAGLWTLSQLSFSGGARPKNRKKFQSNKPKKSSKGFQKQKKGPPPPPRTKFTKTTNNNGKQQHSKPPTKKNDKDLSHPFSESGLPPALLLPTASPYAYVARAAVEDSDLEDSRTIFADIMSSSDSPSSSSSSSEPFHGMTFEYFPPKAFQHKLPDYNKNNSNPSSPSLSSLSSLNKGMIPEVAFLGRSNVGKSSLINALMGRDLARCSKHPGRTQQPYYYGLLPTSLHSSISTTSTRNSNNNNSELLMSCQGFVVDLPGYGFANAPNKTVDEWQHQTQRFLKDRRDAGTLQRLFVLIDARRGLGQKGGTSALDLTILRWLDEASIAYSVVVTKSDQVSAPQLVKVANEACMRYQQQHQDEQEQLEELIEEELIEEELEPTGWMGPVVYLTSAKKGQGIRELRSSVEAEFHAIT